MARPEVRRATYPRWGGPFRNALGAEQSFGDRAIRRAVFARVERAQGFRQTLTPLVREAIWIFAQPATGKRAPETQDRQRPKIKEIVQRQAHLVGRSGVPLFREPQSMRNAGNL